MSIGRIGSGLSGGYWPYHRDSVLGPWEVNGRLWALGWSNEPSSITSVRLFKSENGGATWQYGGPLQSQNMISGNTRIEFGVSAVLVGTILHVASGHGGGVLSLSVTAMDLSGEVSAFVSRTDAFGGNGIEHLAPDGYIPVHLAVRPDGQYLVFFQDAEMSMGVWLMKAGVGRWNGSSWSLSSSPFSVFNWPQYPRGAVLDSDDRVHMLMSSGDGSGDQGNRVRTAALRSDNTWGSVQSLMVLWPFTNGQANYPFMSGSMFKDGLITIGGWGNPNNVLHVRHGAPADQPDWQSNDAVLDFDIEHTDSNPGAFVRDDEGVLHAFVVRADNRHVMHLHDQGSGNWTTPEEIIAEPVRGINANLIEGGAAIGLLYRDDLSSSSTIHFDKMVLDEGEPPPPSGQGHIEGLGVLEGTGHAPEVDANSGQGEIVGVGELEGVGLAPAADPSIGAGSIEGVGVLEGVGSTPDLSPTIGSGEIVGIGELDGVGHVPESSVSAGLGHVEGIGELVGVGHTPAVDPAIGEGHVVGIGELEGSGLAPVLDPANIQGIDDGNTVHLSWDPSPMVP